MSKIPNRPLRTAIIGLSATTSITSWAANAHLPALLSPRGKQNYRITALCNSSIPAARAAIKAFDLPPDTKAYGSPEDLADDNEIDVVICNTRVDVHYRTILPSVRKGKMVYVEWPVTQDTGLTDELVEVARGSGSLVAVGLQGRWAPVVLRVKEVLTTGGKKGGLGKVLSSDVRGFGGTRDRVGMPVGLKYFGEKEVGGNPITIGFAHMIDFVLSVLGEYMITTTKAHTQIQRPKNKAFDPKTKEVVEEFESNVPDLIVVSGKVSSSEIVADGATLSVRYRRGQQFKGEPAFVWSINCEHGEVRLINPSGAALQAAGFDEPPSLQIHWLEDDSVEDVDWSWSKEQDGLPVPARNVLSTLSAFAEGDESGWTHLDSAALRAHQISGWVEENAW